MEELWAESEVVVVAVNQSPCKAKSILNAAVDSMVYLLPLRENGYTPSFTLELQQLAVMHFCFLTWMTSYFHTFTEMLVPLDCASRLPPRHWCSSEPSVLLFRHVLLYVERANWDGNYMMERKRWMTKIEEPLVYFMLFWVKWHSRDGVISCEERLNRSGAIREI